MGRRDPWRLSMQLIREQDWRVPGVCALTAFDLMVHHLFMPNSANSTLLRQSEIPLHMLPGAMWPWYIVPGAPVGTPSSRPLKALSEHTLRT